MRVAPGVSASDIPASQEPSPDRSEEPASQVRVVLDAEQRPLALVRYGADGPVGDAFPITLRTFTGTPLTQLARQIPTRPLHHRFDPVVCTGVNGEYLGVLEVDQLLRVLADEAEAGLRARQGW
jgi:hypothetical protein